jgi:DMSO/TMAO reductase YedYZ molybdopterin-dependent catalytic subunit
MWVIEMKLTKKQELGYWEKQGYHNSGNPWKEQRYTKSQK